VWLVDHGENEDGGEAGACDPEREGELIAGNERVLHDNLLVVSECTLITQLQASMNPRAEESARFIK